ncbi:MAG: hypothetical protein NTY07_07210, partial [Bacteroidia bacterium]|nr:hypothetical protein [Bacteroidia bacterium]
MLKSFQNPFIRYNPFKIHSRKMATKRLFQNQKTVKKDSTAAVYALVHIDNKSIKIGTGVSVTLERFDLKEGRVKGNSKDDNDANLIIDRC